MRALGEVTSTNDLLKELALQGAAEGIAVVARAQTRGRGRGGRVWVSQAGAGVYLSVLLRPALQVSDAGWLAILGGVAAAFALEDLGLKSVTLNWPNDVLVNGRKIAGVLVEPRIGSERIEFAVVGIGVNVRQQPGDWTGELQQTATSCLMEGLDVSCDDVIVRLLEQLDRWYLRFELKGNRPLMQAWVVKGGTAQVPVIE